MKTKVVYVSRIAIAPTSDVVKTTNVETEIKT